jgi:hypothetical protein
MLTYTGIGYGTTLVLLFTIGNTATKVFPEVEDVGSKFLDWGLELNCVRFL